MRRATLCPACGTRRDESHTWCVRCGQQYRREPDDKKPSRSPTVRSWIIGAAVLLLLPLVLIGRRAAGTTSMPKAGPAVAEAVLAPSTPGYVTREWQALPPSFADSLRRGTAAYENGAYAEAVAQYRNAVRIDPDNVDALNNLAQVLARTGHPDEAVPLLDRAIEKDPRRWAFWFNRAHAQGQLQNWKQAVNDYRAAVLLFPDDYATQYNLGLALRHTGDEAAAVSAFEQAVQLAPGESSFVLSLANGYTRLGRREEAAGVFRKFLEEFPEAPADQRQQASTQLASLTDAMASRERP